MGEQVVWQYRVMFDLGHKRENEWCDWHGITKEGYEHTLAEIASGKTRIQVRALDVGLVCNNSDSLRYQSVI